MTFLAGKRLPLIVALLFGLLAAAYTYEDRRQSAVSDSLLHALELKVLDFKFHRRGSVDVEPGVVIAAGDEKTLAAWGRWGTWDRRRYASVLKNLFDAGASVVAFDLVFGDEAGLDFSASQRIVGALKQAQISDRAGALAVKLDEQGKGSVAPQDIAQIAVDALAVENAVTDATSSDELLAQQLSEHDSRIVQGFIAQLQREVGQKSEEERKKTFGLVEGLMLQDFGYGYSVRDGNVAAGEEKTVVQVIGAENAKVSDLVNVPEVNGDIIVPLPQFLEAASYVGTFNADPDPDGTLRRLPLVYRYGDSFVPSMSLMAAALYFGSTPFLIADTDFKNGLQEIVFAAEGGGVVKIPVDLTGALRLNYYGPSEARDDTKPIEKRGAFRRISLADLETNDFDKSLVKGKIVVIAVTAIGTYDQRVTPFTPIAPGTESHVAGIQNMISGKALDRPGRLIQAEMALALLLALVLGLLLPRLNVAASAVVVGSLMAAWLLLDQFVFFKANLWFYQLPLQLQMGLTWVVSTAYGYLSEGREKARLKKEFSTVLNPTVVDELLKNPELAGLGGAERDLTVMFSDIRGFTTMSEKLSPEGLTAFLNEYLTPMTEILLRREGTLDKYMGDAIMAFWGAPITQNDHAARACLAALDMMDELQKTLQPKWRGEGKPEIDIGIGLSSGLMRVGFMGSERMRNYTLLGDNVNLGSRLEGTNKNYGTNIIVSRATFEAAKGAVHGRELDAVRVKGKLEPVKIYELVGRGAAPPDTAVWIASFEQGLMLYRQKRFDDAVTRFKTVIQMRGGNDPPSEIYLERCAHFKEEPPPENWDGVYEFKTK